MGLTHSNSSIRLTHLAMQRRIQAAGKKAKLNTAAKSAGHAAYIARIGMRPSDNGGDGQGGEPSALTLEGTGAHPPTGANPRSICC